MRRRTVVRALGGVAGGTAVPLAGCLTRDADEGPNDPEDGDPEPTEPDHEGRLRVATYRSMVTGTNPAGPRLAAAFEDAYPDAELEWVVPDDGVDHYVRRGAYGGEIDVDVLLGLTAADLARIDDRVGEGGLLRELNADRIGGSDRLRDDLEFGDPHGRALAYDAGHVSLVYDETALAAPETFDDLLTDEYADALLAQRPDRSAPGQAFLLWTVATAGTDDAMAYWDDLVANGARVHDSWTDAYEGAYAAGDRPLVVSYATDPAFAAATDRDPARHRVAFPNDEGYALPEGMGISADAASVDLAYAFLEFVLSEDAQTELARRNVQFPAVEGVELPPAFDRARRPPESVALSYTELRNAADDWLTDWSNRFGEATVGAASRKFRRRSSRP